MQYLLRSTRNVLINAILEGIIGIYSPQFFNFGPPVH